MKKKKLESLAINIFENSDGDFAYSIYESPEDIEAGENELDGGICTSTIENALEMATDQAKELLKRMNISKKEEKKEDLLMQKKLHIVEKILTELNILVACDEEWNTLFGKFEIAIDEDTGRPVIFGLSGSELNC